MEYALLIGVGISIVTSGGRWLAERYGHKASRTVTLAFVLVLSTVAAIIYQYTPAPLWQEAITVFTTALAFYEVVVKSVVKPAFNKFNS